MTELGAFYAVGLSGLVAFGAVVFTMRWISRRRLVRNPLTRGLLRSPGHTLQQQIENLTLDMQADGASMTLVTWIIGAALFAFHETASEAWVRALAIVTLPASLLYLGTRLVRNFQRRENLRLGLDAERATGEELNRLMLRGCRIFHDVPGEGFNIDHVIVGPGGVFAVETKARPKPPRRDGMKDWIVHYDGNVLRFPRGQERRALEQAMRQADWLSAWLRSATGEPVRVRAALALPGWWIERHASGEVIVFNPRNAHFLAEARDGTPLPGPQIERIAHQLEQRCRDVAPQALRSQGEGPRIGPSALGGVTSGEMATG